MTTDWAVELGASEALEARCGGRPAFGGAAELGDGVAFIGGEGFIVPGGVPFFHGWKLLPTAASARGGGVFEANLLHCAVNMASGFPPRRAGSCWGEKGVAIRYDTIDAVDKWASLKVR